MRYYTQKYNNMSVHKLDEFDSLTDAIQSAKALHHPDWDDCQGIKVIDTECEQLNRVAFDSRKGY